MWKRSFAPYQQPASKPRASASPYALAGLGVVGVGLLYYFFWTPGTARETGKELDTKARGALAAVEGKVGMRRGQEEYQKVYDKIAEELEVEDYDGQYLLIFLEFRRGYT